MALSEAVINFNYNKAISKAAELDSAAAQLEADAVNEIGRIMTSIKRDWEGKNSEAYVEKCKQEQTKLQEIANDMRSTASTIRTMAENIKAAELRALAIAKAAAEAAAAALKK